jgi:YD repeat-containing protein
VKVPGSPECLGERVYEFPHPLAGLYAAHVQHEPPGKPEFAPHGACRGAGGAPAEPLGDLRVESAFAKLPGKGEWPLLGCIYRSTDSQSGPFGLARTAAGLLGMKVVGPNNTSNVNVFDELGAPTYFVYSDGAYENESGGQSGLYSTAAGGWLSERPCGSYFLYNSNKRLVSAYDLYDNTLYFYYDGSGYHHYLLSHETGRAVYFQTDAGGRVTSVKDWGGRETALSYDGGGRLNKVVGPSLCVTYFSYDAGGNLNRLTDPEGRTLYYQYDGTDRVTSETYGSAATYFAYDL